MAHLFVESKVVNEDAGSGLAALGSERLLVGGVAALAFKMAKVLTICRIYGFVTFFLSARGESSLKLQATLLSPRERVE